MWTIYHTVVALIGVPALVTIIKLMAPGFFSEAGGSVWKWIRAKFTKPKYKPTPRPAILTEEHLWKRMDQLDKRLVKCQEQHSDCQNALTEARTQVSDYAQRLAKVERTQKRYVQKVQKLEMRKC